MQVKWKFNTQQITGFSDLFENYGDKEFDSPTRSTIPLLVFWQDPIPRLEQFSELLGFTLHSQAELCFEYQVSPIRGKGKPSHTDLMIITDDAAIAIEAKWTEPRYPVVRKWFDGSANKKEVLRGWCELLEKRGATPNLESRIQDIPYQMVHRAASLCYVERVSDRHLSYLAFSARATAEAGSDLRQDLNNFCEALGPDTSLSVEVFECSISTSDAWIQLRKRWGNEERNLHESVIRNINNNELMSIESIDLHCLPN